MTMRVFAALVATVALGSVATAQTAVPRVCFIGFTGLTGPSTAAFHEGLRDAGYVVGATIIVDYFGGPPERLPQLVDDCLKTRTDIIVTNTTPGALAARRASTSVPVVMVGLGDPVGSGLVASLARPDGNVTGLTQMAAGVSSKRLELLKEAVPGLSRVAVLSHVTDPVSVLQVKELEAAAKGLRLHVHHYGVRTPADLSPAIEAAARAGAQGLLTTVEAIFASNRTQIVELATRHRLATMHPFRFFPEVGALMSYGAYFPDLHRRAASFIDRILKGARPGDLPVEQPTRFELVINLKTASALGLKLAPSLVLRADEVIR